MSTPTSTPQTTPLARFQLVEYSLEHMPWSQLCVLPWQFTCRSTIGARGILYGITVLREVHPGQTVYAAVVDNQGIHLTGFLERHALHHVSHTCHITAHTTVYGPVVDDMDHTMSYQLTMACTMGYVMIGWRGQVHGMLNEIAARPLFGLNRANKDQRGAV